MLPKATMSWCAYSSLQFCLIAASDIFSHSQGGCPSGLQETFVVVLIFCLLDGGDLATPPCWMLSTYMKNQ